MDQTQTTTKPTTKLNPPPPPRVAYGPWGKRSRRQESIRIADNMLGTLINKFHRMVDVGQITLEMVELFAALCLRTDDGLPIRPARHHSLWLQLVCDESIKQLLILAPPEAAKTTWSLQAFLGCWVGMFPEKNVIIGSSTSPTAAKRAKSLRTLTESAMWQKLYPGIIRAQGMRWVEDEWSLAPDGKPFSGRLHPTVAAYGTGGSITGSRADLLLGDDVLDFENSRTPGGREFVKNWIHNSFLTRRKSGDQPGRTILIGTLWNANDLYTSLKAQGDWVVCKMPLLSSDPDGYYVDLEYPDNWTGTILGDVVKHVAR